MICEALRWISTAVSQLKSLQKVLKPLTASNFIKGLDIIFLLARLRFVFVTDLFLEQMYVILKSFNIAVFTWLNSFCLYIDP